MNWQIKHTVVVILGAGVPAALAIVDAAPVFTWPMLGKALGAAVFAAVAVMVKSPSEGAKS